MSFSDMMRSGGFRRVLTSNSTATSFGSPLGTFAGTILTSTQLAAYQVFKLNRCLTAEVMFVGVGADGTTFDYRIWGIRRMMTAAGVQDDNTHLVFPIGSGGCTLGTLVGAAGGTGVVATTERVADGVTWTSSAITLIAEAALIEGAGTEYDSTSNDIGMVFIPNLMRVSGLIVDFDMTGATSANALIATDDI